jgi:hypothetical protein
MASEPKPTTAAIVDGLALWQEHKPQSGEDWLAIAQRFIAQQGDARESSPIFAGLVLATERGNANEMRATMAEERVAALTAERDDLKAQLLHEGDRWASAASRADEAVAERDALKAELESMICECRDGTTAALVCERCGQLLPEGNTCSSSLHVGPGEDDFGPSSGDPIASTDLAAQRDEAIRERDAGYERGMQVGIDHAVDGARADVATLLEAIGAWDRQMFPGRRRSRNDKALIAIASKIRERSSGA